MWDLAEGRGVPWRFGMALSLCLFSASVFDHWLGLNAPIGHPTFRMQPQAGTAIQILQ